MDALTLIKKYDSPIPRYTSYPPVPFWSDMPTEGQWALSIAKNYDAKKGIDVYLHIPFCQELCSYCGCNRVISKSLSRQEPFVLILLSEWQLQVDKFFAGVSPVINSIHFGGGTPNFLTPANFERIVTLLCKGGKSGEFIGAVEIDPRTIQDEHLTMFKKLGLARISLGIQDFDPTVQKEINRHQPFELVQKTFMRMRELDFQSINFDLIYGLPSQNLATIENTVNQVLKLGPDQIAFYSYAHLPSKLKNQRLIKEELLPKAEEKYALFNLGRTLLKKSGYQDIGMDHFAKAGSPLARASEEKRLLRSFMGHTEQKSKILLGLGPSAISSTPDAYMQNEKELEKYQKKILARELSHQVGHLLSLEDLDAESIIQAIMCQQEVFLTEKKLQEIAPGLEKFLADEIVVIDKQRLKISEKGRPFMRNVAALFDHRLQRREGILGFSNSI